MTVIRFILLSIMVASMCNSHTLHGGRECPSVTPFPNLSIDKILGQWYVVHQFDTSNTCLMWNIERIPGTADQLEVTEARKISFLDAIGVDFKQSITGTLDMPNPEVPAKLRVRWPTSITGKADFIIFDTDYTEYMAIYQCDRAGFFHRRDVTILSKKPAMDKIFVDRIRRLLDTAVIPHEALTVIDHNICSNTSDYNWHIKGELFGLIPPSVPTNAERRRSEIKDYDISQLEIIGDGISSMAENEQINKKNL